jgi:predicted acetyltransferase
MPRFAVAQICIEAPRYLSSDYDSLRLAHAVTWAGKAEAKLLRAAARRTGAEMDCSGRDGLVLVKPSEEFASDVIAYRDEFTQHVETLHGAGSLSRAATFEEWLRDVRAFENEMTVPVGMVPATTYLAVRESDNRLVGIVNIRHRLTNALRLEGGHIGFSVRRSERRKGYATQMLRQAIAICRDMGIDAVLVTCDENNTASACVIKANGGVRADDAATVDGRSIQRFWITS